jgi:3-hydroxymyristoyl/3-hydroxydecanoyl-(acyl carrier protein) dehydratase
LDALATVDAVTPETPPHTPPHTPPGDRPQAPALPAQPVDGARPEDAVAAMDALAVETARAHRAFLSARRRALAEIAARAGLTGHQPSAPVPAGAPVFDEAAVAAFAEGRLADVLGPDYAFADALPRRVRLPAPPFLALSRVTAIDHRPFTLEPARIATEYDVPDPAWHAVEGEVPYLAMDAQGVLLLLSCLGIDRRLGGTRGFRWLDARLTFLGDRPRVGQRIAYEIGIDRFVEHGETLLFFSNYAGTADGRPMLRIDDCCAGFFTGAELAEGQGLTDPGRPPRPASRERWQSVCGALGEDALRALSAGDFASAFGAAVPAGPALRLPPPDMLMLDRVTQLDAGGGRHGRGLVVAEKDLHPDHWYIRAHFLDDPVFAGPCMIEGALQILQVFLLACGHGRPAARCQPVAGVPLTVKFRGQIPGTASVFTYRVEIVARGLDPLPYVVADVDLIHDGRVRGRLSGLSLQVVPDGTDTRVPGAAVCETLAMEPVA